MSSTHVMVLDHVLRKPGTEAVIDQGRDLYQALSSIGRLAILCGEDEDRADWFLRTNGFIKHAYLIPERSAVAGTPSGRRLDQITRLRSQQAAIQFVVEPDPEIATTLYRAGVPVMVFLHPQFTQPSFRPDYRSVATPWDDLTKEVEYQERMRAENAYKNEDSQ